MASFLKNGSHNTQIQISQGGQLGYNHAHPDPAPSKTRKGGKKLRHSQVSLT